MDTVSIESRSLFNELGSSADPYVLDVRRRPCGGFFTKAALVTFVGFLGGWTKEALGGDALLAAAVVGVIAVIAACGAAGLALRAAGYGAM
jgi:hypothetical protein